jgi:hypothetical protein
VAQTIQAQRPGREAGKRVVQRLVTRLVLGEQADLLVSQLAPGLLVGGQAGELLGGELLLRGDRVVDRTAQSVGGQVGPLEFIVEWLWHAGRAPGHAIPSASRCEIGMLHAPKRTLHRLWGKSSRNPLENGSGKRRLRHERRTCTGPAPSAAGP